MAVDRAHAFARASRAYEWGRARHAAVFAIPLLALSVVAARLGAAPALAVALGGALLVATWFCFWRGQTWGRAVVPGVMAGLIPLACSVAARSYGHVCTGSECFSLCIPACTFGGILAGFIIARTGRRAASRGRFFVSASVLAVLVGAFGCSCVGVGGVAGLGVGLVVTLVPAAFGPFRIVE